jgi:hypothetical protein
MEKITKAFPREPNTLTKIKAYPTWGYLKYDNAPALLLNVVFIMNKFVKL